MASRADATSLENSHEHHEMELLNFPHDLGRDGPFSSCLGCFFSMFVLLNRGGLTCADNLGC
jgi:hypothetical protein